MDFTQEDLKNMAAIIERVNITGKEALAVAVLQQKITEKIKAFDEPRKDPEGPQQEKK